MSLLATVALLIIAYVLSESGLTIVALVVFLLAVLQALSSAPTATPGTPTGQRPVIVTTSGGKIPETIRIVTKKHWPGTDLYEDFQTYLGGVLEWPIRVLIRIFTGQGGRFKRTWDM